MKHLVLVFAHSAHFVLVAAVSLGFGAAQGTAAPPDSVVRIPSHGASATVIYTEEGRTLLLGCAHAYRGADRTKKMKIDVPVPSPGPVKNHTITLIAVDYDLDLSLVELKDGPLPYVCPVAPKGHQPSRNVLSAGYDEMKWPATQKKATIVAQAESTTYTREKPWHGRSGGGLIDLDGNVLIGVVQGYEVDGPQRGMYVSHAAIVRFLAAKWSPQPQPRPQYLPREFYQSYPLQPRGGCPGGHCPNCPR
jgi:hypothetical protein